MSMLMQIVNKEIRANVRKSEAGETVLSYRGARGVCNSIFFTDTEVKALVRALEDAQIETMHDFPIEWGPERNED